MNSTELEIVLPAAIAALPVTLNEKILLAQMAMNPKCSNRKLAGLIGLTERGVKKILQRLRSRSLINHKGQGRARRLYLTFPVEQGTAFPILNNHASNPNGELSSSSEQKLPIGKRLRAIQARPQSLEDDYIQTLRLIHEMTRTMDFFPETVLFALRPLIRRVETEMDSSPEKEKVLHVLYSKEGAFLAISHAVKLPKKFQRELSDKMSRATPDQFIEFRQLVQEKQLTYTPIPLMLTGIFSET